MPPALQTKTFKGLLSVSLMVFWQGTWLSCCTRVLSQTDIQVRLQRAFTEDDRLVYYSLVQWMHRNFQYRELRHLDYMIRTYGIFWDCLWAMLKLAVLGKGTYWSDWGASELSLKYKYFWFNWHQMMFNAISLLAACQIRGKNPPQATRTATVHRGIDSWEPLLGDECYSSKGYSLIWSFPDACEDNWLNLVTTRFSQWGPNVTTLNTN